MADFTLHSVGCGSAKPSIKHNPSCAVLEIRNTLYMIDCGEGAQQQMQKMHLKLSRLNHIFISHLHGDHYLGLPGLLGTLALHGRTGSINIYISKEGRKITEIINSFFNRTLPYEIIWHEINPTEQCILIDNDSITVSSVPLNHRVPCVGFIFSEKPKARHIIREMIDFHKVPISKIQYIKKGEPYIKPDGTVIPAEMLTRDASPSLSYAHISDTKYMPELANVIQSPTLLYHETTYLQSESQQASERFHSTAFEAACIAKKCGAKALLTGHYSSRYTNDNLIKEEALTVFQNTILNREGLSVDITKI